MIYGFLIFLTVWTSVSVVSQDSDSTAAVVFEGKTYPLYPEILNHAPGLPSPYTFMGDEIVTAMTRDSNYLLIPVTVEDGTPLHYSSRVGSIFGKDRQLEVDRGDFPVMAQTGLHSESDLDRKEEITGFPIALIDCIGHPGALSYAGFLASDEDILSVLKGDNRLVAGLGFTHPDMAKPLFHVWNILLMEIESGNWARFWDRIPRLLYNGRIVKLDAQGTKGWQISIFQDEIQGRFDISVHSDLLPDEEALLKTRYGFLSQTQFTELRERLTTIHFSEMAPYYIMRYGFYEGHTDYRTDPIAISFIFGLKRLDEIEAIFPESLFQVLTGHYTKSKKAVNATDPSSEN